MKRVNLENYSTYVFDCDGVLLNSNKVKTQAFYLTALPFGKSAAQALADYHVANGGISRYKKFSYFLKNIVKEQIEGINLDSLLATYARNVKEGLRTCEVASNLKELRDKTLNCRWLIVSGGDQDELREIFIERKLDSLFDGGIFGSPDTKELILHREIHQTKNIKFPALFFGDSKYDYKAAVGEGIDFVFMSRWTEIDCWEQWCKENEISTFHDIAAAAIHFSR